MLKGYYYDKETNILTVPSKYTLPAVQYSPGGENNSGSQNSFLADHGLLLNCGYFLDPRSSKNLQFPHDKFIRFNSNYLWTDYYLSFGKNDENGFINKSEGISLSMGAFSDNFQIRYIDHYKNFDNITNTLDTNTTLIALEGNKINYNEIVFNFFGTEIADDNAIKVNISEDPLKEQNGILYIKEQGKAPRPIAIGGENLAANVIDYSIIDDIIIAEVKKDESNKIIYFVEIIYENDIKLKYLDINFIVKNNYKLLYNEKEHSILIAALDELQDKIHLLIYKFDINDRSFKKIIDSNILNEYEDLRNNFDYYNGLKPINSLSNFVFTYNNELDMYLIAYMYNTENGPNIYHHTFRLFDTERFIKTLKSEVLK